MILDLVFIGLAITLYPLPGMAFVLVVSAPRGLYKGLAFILAWLACLVAVIAMVLLFTGGQPPAPRSPPSFVASVAMLVIGLGLIVYGEHRRRHRHPATTGSGPSPTGDSKKSLSSRMNQASAWSAAGLAVLLQPWGMVSAAAATVVKADLSHTASFLALLGFCLLATATLLAMELYMVFAPEKAQHNLIRLRSWLSRHKDQAIVLICLLLGLWLVGRSLYQLTG
ncbi:GAP family protein [Streptomyces narbonensis]|uniref:GAP family protein n=1 Tax=Streptomyces narbonensis TaxID=67333 RepID=UPI0016720877|nr:GAP family protein [Streptomyces narbonensis]GGV93754.1 hypothetical protein GCM10010230_05330 [Streptomyces narbonensis]